MSGFDLPFEVTSQPCTQIARHPCVPPTILAALYNICVMHGVDKFRIGANPQIVQGGSKKYNNSFSGFSQRNRRSFILFRLRINCPPQIVHLTLLPNRKA
jgi:hypothetical protein